VLRVGRANRKVEMLDRSADGFRIRIDRDPLLDPGQEAFLLSNVGWHRIVVRRHDRRDDGSHVLGLQRIEDLPGEFKGSGVLAAFSSPCRPAVSGLFRTVSLTGLVALLVALAAFWHFGEKPFAEFFASLRSKASARVEKPVETSTKTGTDDQPGDALFAVFADQETTTPAQHIDRVRTLATATAATQLELSDRQQEKIRKILDDMRDAMEQLGDDAAAKLELAKEAETRAMRVLSMRQRAKVISRRERA
jgi:hypothetical protein